jgi:hypothetical protein
MIIGAAIALAISKAVNKFRVKRKPEKKVDFKKDTISMHHDCSDCSAECMLRDSVKTRIKKNIDLCSQTEKQVNL